MRLILFFFVTPLSELNNIMDILDTVLYTVDQLCKIHNVVPDRTFIPIRAVKGFITINHIQSKILSLYCAY